MRSSEHLTADQIQKAVEWWASVIQGPKFDNGDQTAQGGMAMALAILARGDGPTQEQVEVFKQKLTEALQSEDFWPAWGLDCDYHPDSTLSAAAKAAGIHETTFPWKTHM